MAASTTRRKVLLWSPHSNERFAVAANDVRIYECDRSSAGPSRLTLVNANMDITQPKCLAWCTDPALPNIVGVGTTTGKVLLTSFAVKNEPTTIREFTPKQSRPCVALSWNPVYKNYLACGLEKMKFEPSCLVWDVNVSGMATPSAPETRPQRAGSSITSAAGSTAATPSTDAKTRTLKRVPEETKPLALLALSEGTVAVEWVPGQPSCLFVGTSYKWLRLYDLRGDLNAPRSIVAANKAVNGVHFDPFSSSRRLATFSDESIKLWDVRKLTEALMTINTQSKSVEQIAWSPCRANLLASIGADESCVKLWDLDVGKAAAPSSAKVDARKKARQEAKPRVIRTDEPISSFAWHPTIENHMVVLFNSGRLEDMSLHENIALSWSPMNDLSFTYGRNLFAGLTHELGDAHVGTGADDIANVMKSRAVAGYGMDMAANSALFDSRRGASQEELKQLWSWMEQTCQELAVPPPAASVTAVPAAPTVKPYHGLIRLLEGAAPCQMVRPRPQPESQQKGPSVPFLPFPIYVSPARTAALRICGWGDPVIDDLPASDLAAPGMFEQRLKQLEAEGEYEQAAALALFHLDIRRATTALTKDNAPANLRLIAMALSGCQIAENGRTTSLWREMCLALLKQFDHPYLRSAFAFLSTDSTEYWGVLDESGMKLTDRVAFACRFLNDEALNTFMAATTAHLVQSGALAGVLLTGLTERGVALFSAYVDRTSDVQTASLVLSHVVPRDFQSERVAKWVEVYRDLMDQWQLWHQRARFDVARSSKDVVRQVVPAQIFARCNFCGTSLAHFMIAPSKLRAFSNTKTKPQVSSCPSCRKPLPRCELCLLPLGATSTANSVATDGTVKSTAGSSEFDSWFTWCQTCRHGGHARHVMEWFSTHTRCPVSDCSCECMLRDFRTSAAAADR